MKGTKIIAAIIAGALTLGTITVPDIRIPQISIVADAADEIDYADYKYTINTDSNGEYAEITRYTGSDSIVVVPPKLGGVPVKSIGVAAFGANDNVVGERKYAKECVQKVIIPEGVTTIKRWAFNKCKNLQSISLPDSLETIGEQAFWLCDSLESITIPKNASNTAGGAFMACRGLKEVVFSDGVTEISNKMFITCTSLNSVTIPDTVTSIGYQAFGGCKNLKEINIPDSVETLGESAFSGCETLSKVKLSDNITSIQKNTFYGCTSLKEISLPYYTSTIGKDAFYNVPLEVIIIGTKLKSIDNLPIHLSTLKAINVSDDNFYYSSDNGILYNKDRSTLIRFPAAMNKTEYKSPDTLLNIGESAFADNSSIRNVYLYEKCSSVEPTAFQNCTHLDKIYFYNKNCEIYMSKNTIYEDAVINGYKNSTAKDYADTYGRAFNAISIDPSIFFGKWQAYKAYYQGEDHFPTSSSTWQNTTWTFNNDYSGEYTYNNGSITINWQIDGNTIIVNKAVLEYDGTDLIVKTISDGEEIIYYFKKTNSGINTTTTTTATTITTTTSTTTTTTPKTQELFYQGLKYKTVNEEIFITGYTDDLPSVVNIPAKIGGISVTKISGTAFSNCRNLTSITIPDSVTSIGSSAFSNCKSLTNITIPDSVTQIYNHAFCGCKSLTNITIPDSVTSIGYQAFSDTSLTEITIPNSVTSIAGTFSYCQSLISITIPDSVTSIGNEAFEDCINLTSITIPNSVTSIGEHAFSGCTGLKEINIPNSVTSIGYRAFYNCRNLTSITIPDSVTSIEDEAIVNYYTNLIIKGDSGSYAETYANNNYIHFELIEKTPTTTVVLTMAGDVNNDGTISIADAVSLQNFLLGRTKTLGNWKNADLCKDNRIDVFDMVLMRRLLIEKMN